MKKINDYKSGELAMASINVVSRNGKRVWFAYRADSKMEQDSGWVFHGPNEGDVFCDDSSNFVIVPISAMLEINPGLDDIISMPRWTCWERYSDNGKWFAVNDFFHGNSAQPTDNGND
jgi:hypothetical protein